MTYVQGMQGHTVGHEVDVELGKCKHPGKAGRVVL